ncbi:hypothetical protein M3Y98_00073900 [Aphelenchoides besseyi]|nr:hypothetical protein M3Y98_00073900 [Aphelenchoides besseyi]
MYEAIERYSYECLCGSVLSFIRQLGRRTAPVERKNVYVQLSSIIDRLRSPYIFSPNTVSPAVFEVYILSPYCIAPNVINPYVMSPIILSPHVLSPDVMSSTVLSGAILNPFVLGPAVLTQSALAADILSPSFLS